MNKGEGHDPLAALNLPADELFSAADRAEGFVLALETVKALNPASLEGLYVAFENAATARRLEHAQ